MARCMASALALYLMLSSPASPQSADGRQAELLSRMDAQSQHYADVSQKIWDLAEVGYQEQESAELLKAELQRAGFSIRDRIAGIPTAFSADWGAGKPVIAVLGEYDALPGLSQQPVPERRPVVPEGPGHGCGHNLLGTAAAFAAIAVKEHLAENKMPGTIRFYGTPAEEGGGGKIYMVRAGAFQDCDIVLTWHPGYVNRTSVGSNLANISAKFRFRGTPAHAGGAPEKGRSALDALMIMNHALELLREHVPEETRLHYIITHGGSAPNTVPDFAEGYYYARHPSMPVLDGIWARLVKCAEAGAHATETGMEMEIVSSTYNMLPNDVLASIVDRNLRRVGGARYTPEEQAFAEAIRRTLPAESLPPMGLQEQVLEVDRAHLTASSDAGDVSWVVPTAELTAATWVPGTPAHSWQSTACSGMSIGIKGMLIAAKTLALTAVDLFADAGLVRKARDNFEKRRDGHEYRSRLPLDHKPPLDYRARP